MFVRVYFFKFSSYYLNYNLIISIRHIIILLFFFVFSATICGITLIVLIPIIIIVVTTVIVVMMSSSSIRKRLSITERFLPKRCTPPNVQSKYYPNGARRGTFNLNIINASRRQTLPQILPVKAPTIAAGDR